MAEGLFRDAVKQYPGIEVSSAGVATGYGQPPSPHAVEVLRPWAVDISRKRSQPLTEDLVDEATHIFVMTRGHMEAIQTYFPEAAEKTFLLREFDTANRGGLDVPDPIGLGIHAYFECRDTIKRALPGIIKFIDPASSSMSSPQPTAAAAPQSPASTHPLRIALGADHGGIELKQAIHAHLSKKGFVVSDFGAYSHESVDYPDYAEPVCRHLIANEFDFGILVCKSGIGMSIAANRFPQIRASLVDNADDAKTTRQHNDSNVLCLSSNHVEPTAVGKIVDAFLNTAFEHGRHERRVEKLDHLGTSNAIHPSLEQVDPEIYKAIQNEELRQFENIELIASENFTSRAVMEAQGSCLTNKYAEGYPGRRWYGGCENVDVVEQLAIDRAKQLFGGDHVNVQPHSGSQANTAVYFSVLQPGDKILTMDLAHGGHLTHGHKANFSGRFYAVTHYGVSQVDERIDYDALAKVALEVKPRMITGGRLRLPAHHRFPAHAGNRRQRGRLSFRGHGAHRGARGRGPSSESDPDRGFRHHHHP